jgi:hypothetical protein
MTLPGGASRKRHISFTGDTTSPTRAGVWGSFIRLPRRQSGTYKYCRRIERDTRRDPTWSEDGRRRDLLVAQFVYGFIEKFLQAPIFFVDSLCGGG